MGRRKKRNKKKRGNKSRYNKKQFTEIYCSNCELCYIQPPTASFCYDELYKTNPDKFFKDCLGDLILLKHQLDFSNGSYKDVSMKQFCDIICKGFCRKDSCGLISECFNTFKKQLKGKAKDRVKMSRRKKARRKRRKLRERFICQPYPTMFTNDSKEWLCKIDNILSNGNNNRKQDKVEESTKQSEGQINK